MRVTSVIEQILFTTVRLTTTDGSAGGLGTAFIYSHTNPADDSSRLFVVTNKHVIAGADTATLHFIAKDGGGPRLGREFPVTLSQPELMFRGHPNPEVDVAMMSLAGVFQILATQGQQVFFRSIPEELCADTAKLAQYEPIEPVTFVGYPDGLFDQTSLLPIVRRGHSATAMDVDYGGKPTFLIDASVFPGSSGSPVFLIANPSSPDKHGNIRMSGAARVLFLGVVAAVYQREVPVLTTARTPYSHEMLDLGIVYKASAVAELARTL